MAKAFRMLRDANEEAYYDRSSERQIASRATMRQALWEAHMQSPTAALEEVLRRTEAGAERAESATADGSETQASIGAPSLVSV